VPDSPKQKTPKSVEVLSYESYFVRVWLSIRDDMPPLTAWTWPA
jgi:hypothetical protein